MRTSIFHSVNSALYLWTGKTGILIDGLHGGPKGFSPIPGALAGQMEAGTGLFAHLDVLLFTHTHSDHFSAQTLETLLRRREDLGVFGAGVRGSNLSLRPLGRGMGVLELPGVLVFVRSTVHDGKDKAHPHCSYLIENGGETVFAAGDAYLTSKDAEGFFSVCGRGIDAAFFNPYQLDSRFGLAYIDRVRPRRVFVIHLPFPQEDVFYHHLLARQLLKGYPEALPKPEILPHMAWLDGNPPPWWDGPGG